MDIVLASGEQVVASETSNPDLFWAVRGAGQNFGVTTAFTFQGHDQKNQVFAGTLVHLPGNSPALSSSLDLLGIRHRIAHLALRIVYHVADTII